MPDSLGEYMTDDSSNSFSLIDWGECLFADVRRFTL